MMKKALKKLAIFEVSKINKKPAGQVVTQQAFNHFKISALWKNTRYAERHSFCQI